MCGPCLKSRLQLVRRGPLRLRTPVNPLSYRYDSTYQEAVSEPLLPGEVFGWGRPSVSCSPRFLIWTEIKVVMVSPQPWCGDKLHMTFETVECNRHRVG